MVDWLFKKLAELPAKIAALSRDQRKVGDNARSAISRALMETFIYYRDMENGKERDLDIEAQLAKYWSAAAIPVRHIDPELAEICDYKSQYWVHPEHWTKEKVREFRIGLYDVQEHYRRLLRPKSFINNRAES